jgi:pectinesterase
MPTLTFAGTARVYGTVYSATLQVDSAYFVSSNIIIKVRITQNNGACFFVLFKVNVFVML